MASTPEVSAVELEGEHFRVRFHDPDEFDEVRTSERASDAARELAPGSEVRMGRRAGDGDWTVQAVLVPKPVGKSKARERAKRILDEIEPHQP